MVGLQAGPTITMSQSNVVSPQFDNPPFLGFTFGLPIHYGIKFGYNQEIAIRFGFTSTYKGYRFIVREKTGILKSKMAIQPFELPLTVGMRTRLHKHLFLREYIGLSLNFVHTTTGSDNGILVNDQTGTVVQFKHQGAIADKWTLSVDLGFSMEWEFNRIGFLDLTFSYHYGFSNNMYGYVTYVINGKVTNAIITSKGNYFATTIGVFFDLPEVCPFLY